MPSGRVRGTRATSISRHLGGVGRSQAKTRALEHRPNLRRVPWPARPLPERSRRRQVSPRVAVSSAVLSAALTIAALGLLSFCAGLIVRRLFAQRMMARVESAFLSKAACLYIREAGRGQYHGHQRNQGVPSCPGAVIWDLASWHLNRCRRRWLCYGLRPKFSELVLGLGTLRQLGPGSVDQIAASRSN
jgi:hypothetical protein